MQKNKSRGNDGLSKELYEETWDDIKQYFILVVNKADCVKQLSAYQR